jgi:hypothetical protein
VLEWEYLRCKDDGTPVAGSFPGWPERAAEVTVMDPCCGSGHFLVAAFDMLRRMRMEEEGLDAAEAARRTLQENIFGLEIDQRCTQIAWFALSLVGWKSGGYQPLPELNIACSGIPVKGQLKDWLELAGDDSRVKAGLERLYNLFKDAPDLGSLINPADVPMADRIFVADYEQVEPLLNRALANENQLNDPVSSVLGFAAQGAVQVTKYLVRKYTIILTNVPYLGRNKQSDILKSFCDQYHFEARKDIATAFIERCNEFIASGGTVCVVTPQYWQFLSSYKKIRIRLLREHSSNLVSKLGPGAFKTIGGEIVNVLLFISTRALPNEKWQFYGLDASSINGSYQKSIFLKNTPLQLVVQKAQLENPDARISIRSINSGHHKLVGAYATYGKGSVSGDSPHYLRKFWEFQNFPSGYKFWLNSPSSTTFWGGRENIVLWNVKGHDIKSELGLRVHGQRVWNKKGVAIAKINNLFCTLYDGELFDDNLVVLSPFDTDNLSALWAFCTSNEFRTKMRELDSKLGITAGTFIKAFFDIDYWRSVAKQSDNLPAPDSDDPTQWLFKGNLVTSSAPLQVAIAHLLGYHWPEQYSNRIKEWTDNDGIVSIPAINGRTSAADRLRELLSIEYGDKWSVSKQEELLACVGFSGKDLAEWVRDSFFEQHCRLFHNRPFIWHIWDGRNDGFSALVNYHKLDRANLEKLTYFYLGTWISDRKKDMEKGVAGAEGRLLAAQILQDKLKLILAGEPPYDIYARWKPLHEQPIGWEPDLNDGVRLNIRPFVTAGVLRSKFTINWNKDRGKNPDGSERFNDLHFTNEQKREARRSAGKETV